MHVSFYILCDTSGPEHDLKRLPLIHLGTGWTLVTTAVTSKSCRERATNPKELAGDHRRNRQVKDVNTSAACAGRSINSDTPHGGVKLRKTPL